MNPRKKLADVIKAEVDSLFHHCEKNNLNGEITYLDIVRISDRVIGHFDGETPAVIANSVEVAQGLLHPKKLEGIALIKKGLGALVSITGGMTLLWGILQILAYGVVATSTSGVLWWQATTVTILFGGPVGIAAGLGSAAVGIYMLSRKTSSKKLAATAHDIIIKSITLWEESDDLLVKNREKYQWVTELPEDAYQAFLSLMWIVAQSDEQCSAKEMDLLYVLMEVRKPLDIKVANGMISADIADLCRYLRSIDLCSHCIDALYELASADGHVTGEEKELIDQIKSLIKGK